MKLRSLLLYQTPPQVHLALHPQHQLHHRQVAKSSCPHLPVVSLLNVYCLSLCPYIAASLDVKTLGDGTATLVCRATDVLTMQWSVSYLAISRTLNLEMILDSATEDLPVTEGITLSSTVTSQDTDPSIQSTMSVSSESSRVENTIATFICSGTTRSGSSFRNEAAISVALPNPTTSPPTTTPTAPVAPQTGGQELLPSPSSSKFTQCIHESIRHIMIPFISTYLTT